MIAIHHSILKKDSMRDFLDLLPKNQNKKRKTQNPHTNVRIDCSHRRIKTFFMCLYIGTHYLS